MSAFPDGASRPFCGTEGGGTEAADGWARCVAVAAQFLPIFPSECNQEACVRTDAHAEESERLRGESEADDGCFAAAGGRADWVAAAAEGAPSLAQVAPEDLNTSVGRGGVHVA